MWNFKERPELPNAKLATEYWESPHKQIFEDFWAKCVKVHDGDTIRVHTDFREFDFPVRFLGTDAPELNEEGGKEAKEYLESLILGEEILIIMNRKQRVGKWGRLLGKVMWNGMDMGEDMIRRGHSVPFGQRREGEIPDIKWPL